MVSPACPVCAQQAGEPSETNALLAELRPYEEQL